MQDDLIIDYCSYEASKYACEHFHYSHKIPSGKLVKHGVWENGKFIGCVLYGDSANANMHTPYNLKYENVCELRRVALKQHKHPVTEIVAKSLKFLHRTNPGLEIVISYADKNQGHLGIIYQAGNWFFENETKNVASEIVINGNKFHPRTVYDMYGTSSMKWIKDNVDPDAYRLMTKGKFKYIYPLTKRARRRFEHLQHSYPKKID